MIPKKRSFNSEKQNVLNLLLKKYNIRTKMPDENSMMHAIRDFDRDIFYQLTEYFRALDTLSFLANDGELRHKLPDVWKKQYDLAKKEIHLMQTKLGINSGESI